MDEIKEYTIVQVIEEFIKNKDLKFQRVLDENFMIKRGYKGDIKIYIKGQFKGHMQIFNYIYDKFIKIEGVEE